MDIQPERLAQNPQPVDAQARPERDGNQPGPRGQGRREGNARPQRRAGHAKGPRPVAPALPGVAPFVPKAKALAKALPAPAKAKVAPAAVFAAPLEAAEPVPVAHKIGFSQASALWMPKVNPDGPVDRHLKTLNLVPRYSVDPVNDVNNHPAQAAERSIATARALGLIYQRGIRVVTGVYGNERDEKIVAYCNGQVRNAPDKMEFIRYSPIVTTKDFTRRPTMITYADATVRSECLFLVDIYATDVNISTPWSPSSAARLLESLPNPYGGTRLVWVGRKFYGDAGVIANEGGWYRDEKNMIHYRSSRNDPEEYIHDPCDWMWTRSSASIVVRGAPATLSWTVVKIIGTTHILEFVCSPYPLVDSISGVPLYPFQNNLVSVRCPQSSSWAYWLSPILSYIPSFIRAQNPFLVPRLVYRPVYESARNECQARRYTPTNFSRVVTVLSAAQSNNASGAKLFFELFPRFLITQELNSVAWGIMNSDIEERRYSNEVAHSMDAQAMAEVNDSHARIGVPPASVQSGRSFSSTAMLIVATVVVTTVVTRPSIVLTGASFILRKVSPSFIKPSFSAAMIVRVPYPTSLALPECYGVVNQPNPVIRWWLGHFLEGVVAPLVEESIKRALMVVKLGWLFPVFEFFSTSAALQVADHPLDLVLMARVPALLIHLICNQLSFQNGLLLHAGWNLLLARLFKILLVTITQDPRLQEFLSVTVVTGAYFKTLLCFFAFCGTGVLYLAYRHIFRAMGHTQVWKLWRKTYYLAGWEDRHVYDDFRSFSVQFDPEEAYVPEQESGLPLTDQDVKALDGDTVGQSHLLIARGKFPDLRLRGPTCFTLILPTCAPGFVPKPGAINLKVAIAYRLLRPPPIPPKDQMANWKVMAERFEDGLFLHLGDRETYTPNWEDIVDEWVAHFEDTKKRKMYSKIVQELRTAPNIFVVPEDTDVFVKHDEMLMQQKDGYYTLKPRIIANVNPKFQAAVGPYVYRCQLALGKLWTADSSSIRHVVGRKYIAPTWFHFMTGGGKTDREISLWMRNVLDRVYVPAGELGFCILVCGDDSVVAYCMLDRVVFFEGDASMYDQSNSFGPLWFQYKIMQWQGLDGIPNYLYKQSKNSYRVTTTLSDSTFYWLSRQDRAMRDTGGSDTYYGNTVIMASSWWFVLRTLQYERWAEFESDPLLSTMSVFKQLGFDMKMKVFDDFRQVSFLKGLWYETAEGIAWGPLPSRILKMGKSLKDPRGLYGVPDARKACEMFLADVSNSYATFLQVPFVRAFVCRYRRNLDKPHSSARVSQYGAASSDTFSHLVLRDEDLIAVCERYGFDLEALHRVEHMILTSETFTFLHDPVFLRLAAVDYA